MDVSQLVSELLIRPESNKNISCWTHNSLREGSGYRIKNTACEEAPSFTVDLQWAREFFLCTALPLPKTLRPKVWVPACYSCRRTLLNWISKGTSGTRLYHLFLDNHYKISLVVLLCLYSAPRTSNLLPSVSAFDSVDRTDPWKRRGDKKKRTMGMIVNCNINVSGQNRRFHICWSTV